MKWSAWALAGVVLSSAPAWAQGTAFGVRAGVNLANVSVDSGDDSAGFDRSVRGVAGAFATFPMWGSLAFQPEVLFSQKGAALDFSGIDSTVQLDYLEVPLLARISPAAFAGGRLYLAAGPSLGYLARAKTRTAFGGSTEEVDVIDELVRFDLGIVGAVGFTFRSLVFDARYTHGISDVDEDEDATLKTRTWSFTGGIRF